MLRFAGIRRPDGESPCLSNHLDEDHSRDDWLLREMPLKIEVFRFRPAASDRLLSGIDGEDFLE
jgi:hypothetical protein